MSAEDKATEDMQKVLEGSDFTMVMGTQGGGLVLLEAIKQAAHFDPNQDVSTVQNRKLVISYANQVRRAKTAIDKAGKALVDPLKEKAKLVDVERKILRDGCDELSEMIRKPVTDYEEEEKKAIAEKEERLAMFERMDADHEEAILVDRNILLEAENKRLAVIADTAEKEREERERLEREAKIAEDARVEAEAKAESDRVEAEKKAELDKEAAVEAEKKKAIDRETFKRMEAEKEEAVEVHPLDIRRAFQRVAENKEHRRHIHTEAYESLKQYSFTENESRAIVEAVRSGRIKHMRIIY